jgi:hypothetical protein
VIAVSPYIGIPAGIFLIWLCFRLLFFIADRADEYHASPPQWVDLSKDISPYSRQAQENIYKASSITEQRRYGNEGQYGRDVTISVDRLPEELLGSEASAQQGWLVKHGPETNVFSRTEGHR